MKKNSNLILAAIMVFGFMMLWERAVVRKYAPVQPISSPSSQTPAPASPAEPARAFTDHSRQPGLKAGTAQTVTLQNAEAMVRLTAHGAGVESWQVRERDHWVELIKPGLPAHPLETFPGVIFDVTERPSAAVFTTETADGLLIQKTFTLKEANSHSLSLAIRNTSSKAVAVQDQIGWYGTVIKRLEGDKPEADDQSAAESRSIAGSEAGLRSWKPGILFGKSISKTESGPFDWFGIDNNHFIAALISRSEPIDKIHIEANKKSPPQIGKLLDFTLQPGETKTIEFKLYVGPKRLEDLRAAGKGLEKAVDFGFFGAIAKALLSALRFFKGLTGNYGWAIVLLTVCVQMLMLPLTTKSLKHAVRMKELQPQLKVLQAQFKSDPKRLQVETFNLYKKNGMHLMGMEGCVPVLLQIPVFFAFYSALNVAYELRGAPWILWIRDLAHHDPFFVLPILMGAGMFFQQKASAPMGDPAQAKMMMFMPVIFTFMFFKLPAGLVLYWCVNSVCTIIVQKVLAARHASQPARS